MQGETEQTLAHRRRMAAWVAREIIPHEPHVRAWLARARAAAEDVDELIQEAYCRLALLERVDHIESPRAYFFSIARNLYLRRLKRQQIVRFEEIAEVEALRDDTPSPEQAVASKLAYRKVLGLIAELPERCRRIVELRKIEGWSHREIAAHFDVSQKTVEKEISLGLKTIHEKWDALEAKAVAPRSLRVKPHERRR